MANARLLASALRQLDPHRITVAREQRGLTKKALAEKIGKSPSAITQFENGKSGLDLETFSSLSLALGFPPVFFTKRPFSLSIDFSTCHFRANRSVPQIERRRVLQHATSVVELYRAIERRGIVFPEVQVPLYSLNKYSPPEIERLAREIRQAWGLGDGPILDMAKLLESKGIFVVLMPEEFAKLHAFGFWAEDRPCVVASASLSASHLQFDHGHELAHIILHMEEAAGDPESERIANHFSGAFLAPARSFAPECPRSWNYFAFYELKQRWHLSIQAALYRARQLKLLSESSYKWGMVWLSKNNFRQKEEGEFDKPLPTMLESALEMLNGEVLLDDLALDVGLTTVDLEKLLVSQGVRESCIEQLKPARANNSKPVISLLRTSGNGKS